MKKTARDYFYVGIQILLFAAYLFPYPILYFEIPFWIKVSGFILTFIGIAFSFLSILSLRPSLSIFPSPKQGGILIDTGLFAYFRHPIYTGIIIATLAYGLYSESGFRLLISLSLFILFYFKAKYEEGKLKQVFPNYSEYHKRTWMFFPGM